MIIVFIDDNDIRHDIVEEILGGSHTILHCYDYGDAIIAFKGCQTKIGLAMFDHDITDYFVEEGTHKQVERTGSDIASYILYNLDESHLPARVIAHSSNYSGALNIVSKFASAGIHAIYECFSREMIMALAKSLEPQ
jgi:hypothetical protein